MANAVLIADVPELEDALTACFPEDDVIYVSTYEDALRQLSARSYTLVVIGLHFDNSTLFELLRHVRSDERFAKVPVLCIRALPSRLSDAARHGIDHAVRMLGAQAFIDVRPGPNALEEICERLTRSVKVVMSGGE